MSPEYKLIKQVRSLTEEKEILLEQTSVLVEALNEAYREIDRLIALVNPVPETTIEDVCTAKYDPVACESDLEEDVTEEETIEIVNSLLQEAGNEPSAEAYGTIAVPAGATIDSVIAGTLIRMDKNEPTLLTPQDLTQLVQLKKDMPAKSA